MFEIKCLNCNTEIQVTTGKNTQAYAIGISGEVEVQYDADIYISCRCGNEITISK